MFKKHQASAKTTPTNPKRFSRPMWKVQTDLRPSRVQALGTSFPLFSRMLVHLLCLEKGERVGGDYAWASSSRPEHRPSGTCQADPLPLILSAQDATLASHCYYHKLLPQPLGGGL